MVKCLMGGGRGEWVLSCPPTGWLDGDSGRLVLIGRRQARLSVIGDRQAVQSLKRLLAAFFIPNSEASNGMNLNDNNSGSFIQT